MGRGWRDKRDEERQRSFRIHFLEITGFYTFSFGNKLDEEHKNDQCIKNGCMACQGQTE
jgi:hypothetical protein